MEFDFEIKGLDKLTKQITGELSKIANGINVGVFGEQGSDLVILAATNEFGTDRAGAGRNITIPERSFIRSTMLENRSLFQKFIKAGIIQIMNGEITSTLFLNRLGLLVQSKIQQKINSGPFEPNAPSTIARKKSAQPLIDTGRLRQSITYRLV